MLPLGPLDLALGLARAAMSERWAVGEQKPGRLGRMGRCIPRQFGRNSPGSPLMLVWPQFPNPVTANKTNLHQNTLDPGATRTHLHAFEERHLFSEPALACLSDVPSFPALPQDFVHTHSSLGQNLRMTNGWHIPDFQCLMCTQMNKEKKYGIHYSYKNLTIALATLFPFTKGIGISILWGKDNALNYKHLHSKTSI